MEQPYKFKSPKTGEEYASEFPINPKARENTLFVEKIERLNELSRISGIPSSLMDAGPDVVSEFERMLHGQGKGLEDLLHLKNRAQPERDEAEREVIAFISEVSQSSRQRAIQRIIQLI